MNLRDDHNSQVKQRQEMVLQALSQLCGGHISLANFTSAVAQHCNLDNGLEPMRFFSYKVVFDPLVEDGKAVFFEPQMLLCVGVQPKANPL